MQVNYFFFSCLVLFSCAYPKSNPFTIMLDPAGDARNAGRKINDYLERGVTLQYAEQLKKALEKGISNVRVILTRFPGETIQPLQNASFANRLDVDFYVSIHFFGQKKGKHTVALDHFCTHPVTDYWKTTSQSLSFVKAHNVHKESIETSKKWSLTLHELLEKDYKDHFVCSKPLGLPFKPLCGIKAPVLGIEASLQSPDDWTRYIKPISEGIIELIEQVRKGRRNRAFFT